MTGDGRRGGKHVDGGRAHARARAGLVSLLLVPALAACGSSGDDGTTTPGDVPSAGTATAESPTVTEPHGGEGPTGPPVPARTVAETAQPGDVVVVDAALVEDERAELCDVVGETYPPVCSPAILELTGAPLDDLNLFEASGVRWGGVVIVVEVVDEDTVAYVDVIEQNETPSGAPAPRETWTVTDALEIAEPNLGLVVDGVLVTTDAPAGSAYVCDEVTGTEPPACDEPRIEVSEVPLDQLDLDVSGGERSGPVRLSIGFVDDGTAVFLREH
ncbi:hypothetical protein ACPYO6_03525 [Georgenia sp. Z1344]|uniref:hypothetical protein n=1 Tax=Georgenia sp. Z1344 TaxID=3416706 RepID=UPI003CE9FD55